LGVVVALASLVTYLSRATHEAPVADVPVAPVSSPRVEAPVPRPPPPPAVARRGPALPPEARETLALIDAGGPFPFDRDGVVFENREGLLPSRRRGYYREYTVKTPGQRTRGARRIIAGEGGERFYSDDHYETFTRVDDPP
jgi:ribonuclease T1